MKITALETKLIGLGYRNCIVVLVHTDDGIVGYGETVLKRRSKTVEQNLHELGRYLVGQDAVDFVAVRRRVSDEDYIRFSAIEDDEDHFDAMKELIGKEYFRP